MPALIVYLVVWGDVQTQGTLHHQCQAKLVSTMLCQSVNHQIHLQATIPLQSKLMPTHLHCSHSLHNRNRSYHLLQCKRSPPTLQPQPQTHHQSQHRPERPPISFTWGVYSGQEMFDIITSTYDEVIHWKHNLFQVPSGGTGCSFVKELARLLQGFADGSSLECVCMKAVTLLQILLLQKPNSKSKTKDHVIHLKRRLTIWYDGNIKHLLEEGRCIQRRIPKGHKATAEQSLARTFSNLMAKGKVKNALRLLDRSHSGGRTRSE